jgi:hypothetical protein
MIFMPPVHFSIFMVQRGTIIMFGVPIPVEGTLMPDVPMPIPVPDIMADRSIITLFIPFSFVKFLVDPHTEYRQATARLQWSTCFGCLLRQVHAAQGDTSSIIHDFASKDDNVQRNTQASKEMLLAESYIMM